MRNNCSACVVVTVFYLALRYKIHSPLQSEQTVLGYSTKPEPIATWRRRFFPRLIPASCFSRAHKIHKRVHIFPRLVLVPFFPRLSQVTCFLRLVPAKFFPALGIGYIFPALYASCFPRLIPFEFCKTIALVACEQAFADYCSSNDPSH